ncbi:hypothetical protein KM043_017245 [Ampulex compressa]|nr:hypothetical protein KM043_017245 [Ampulex compressa]
MVVLALNIVDVNITYSQERPITKSRAEPSRAIRHPSPPTHEEEIQRTTRKYPNAMRVSPLLPDSSKRTSQSSSRYTLNTSPESNDSKSSIARVSISSSRYLDEGGRGEVCRSKKGSRGDETEEPRATPLWLQREERLLDEGEKDREGGWRGGEGCSTYKRAVAPGASQLPTFPRRTGYEARRGAEEAAKEEDEEKEGGGEGAAERGYEGEGEEVHLVHPPTVPSFLPLLMIACTVPPSMHRRLHGQQQQRPRQHRRRGIYAERNDGAGEHNYQSTPPPPCTEALPRRQRRLPFLLPSRVSSEARMGP